MKAKYKLSVVLVFVLLFVPFGCDRIKKKTKETINKGGETVGKTATEFFEGVSKGVSNTLQCEIRLSEDLKGKGLETGAFSIENNGTEGEHNLLVLYLIFNKDFDAPLNAKVFNNNDLEIGRARANVVREAGDAGYFDFVFDKRTYIEARSVIVIE